MPKLLSFEIYAKVLTKDFPFISWTHSKKEGMIEVSLDDFNFLERNFEDWDNV
mgnify:CR=1 FL=1